MTQASDGFAKHGIDHLSASSINLWGNAPDVWVMQYLHFKRTPMGPAAWRGICTEDAVAATLMGGAITECIDLAIAKFDGKYIIGDEATTRERDRIKPMTELAVAELQQYGKPFFPEVEEGDHHQNKIEIIAKGDGWTIPVIGYLDLVYPDHGVIIDLKTTGRIPTQMSAEHQLQRAIYAKGNGNMAVKFLYVSEKKTNLLEDGDPTELLAKAKVQIGRMEAFLRHVDKDIAREIVPLNTASFYWSGNEALRKEFYGV